MTEGARLATSDRERHRCPDAETAPTRHFKFIILGEGSTPTISDLSGREEEFFAINFVEALKFDF